MNNFDLLFVIFAKITHFRKNCIHDAILMLASNQYLQANILNSTKIYITVAVLELSCVLYYRIYSLFQYYVVTLDFCKFLNIIKRMNFRGVGTELEGHTQV